MSWFNDNIQRLIDKYWRKERKRSREIRASNNLRERLHFDRYLIWRPTADTCTFLQHLRTMVEAIEE